MEGYVCEKSQSTQSSTHLSSSHGEYSSTKRSSDDASGQNTVSYTECSNAKRSRVDFNLEDLVSDPGVRPQISSYDVSDQDTIRRAYLQKGPCQPRDHIFPPIQIQKKLRSFQPSWFDDYGNWLEYSISQNAAYCLYCFVFPRVGGDGTFVKKGFCRWKSKEGFEKHIGKHNSPHNIAREKCEDLMNQRQASQAILFKKPKVQKECHIYSDASIDCVRTLLHQGLPFCGHKKSEELFSPGHLLELYRFLATHNEIIQKFMPKNSFGNFKLTSPKIQKDIVSALASQVMKKIVKDIGNDFFSILIDETRDISANEKMTIILRYVDVKGNIIERLLCLVPIFDITALSLKVAIDNVFCNLGLNISMLRGQGYNGTGSMQEEFNGLKRLIMRENPCAYYTHCFAHQLHSTLVAVVESHDLVASLFEIVGNVKNIVGGSCTHSDNIREKKIQMVAKELEHGDLLFGQDSKHDCGIKCPRGRRWTSHYGILLSFTHMFSSIMDALDIIIDDGNEVRQRVQARVCLQIAQTFEFVFILHLMMKILGITNELSQVLQRKDLDISNALTLVRITKMQLNNLRNENEKWVSFLVDVFSFCDRHYIEVLEMSDIHVALGRRLRDREEKTNEHYYRAEIFNNVIDLLLDELNDRFNEINTHLLLGILSFDPSDSFRSFDKEKLIRLARLYPSDFTPVQCCVLESQLDTYILDMRTTPELAHVDGISGLARRLVELKKDRVYPLVYMLLKLVLLLPIATASVERVSSAMRIINCQLSNKLGEEGLNDCLIAYIEKDVVDTIDNKTIIQHFQSISSQ